DARLNFAENMLRRNDDAPALIALREDGKRSLVTFAELRQQVSRLAQAMQGAGIGVGDRVAGVVPNVPEAIIAMLAAASIGAIWSCCAPEFGVAAIVDRLGQIEPKLLITSDGYLHGGTRYDIRDRVASIVEKIPSIATTLVVPVLAERPDVAT